ncbi:DUF3185 domain-containing protein [Vampirovibrio sp.]|uniref:DUF3185 domain-containing protein n=1 Tax=Vampirovibrio sp. TaxID=2717857 RepID=UPI0035942ABC
MKQIIGIVLVIIGIAYFSFQGFRYTAQEKVLDIGPFEATKTSNQEFLPYSPLLGGAIIAGGVALFLAGFRRPSA